MPSLRQLQYLVALVDTGHYRQAAERVGVSQPTLSAQLTALERRLGVALIERNRSPVILTSAGVCILERARRIVTEVQDIHDLSRNHRKAMSGVLRLGLPASIGPYLLPAVLPVLRQTYPDLRFYIREELPEALPDALAAGKHDLVVNPLPVRSSDIHTMRLFREPIYLAVPLDHPLGERDSIDCGELEGQRILALEKGHALHDQVVSICQEHGVQIHHDYEGTSLHTLHQMVVMGLGLTFLPGLYAGSIDAKESGLKLLTLKGKPLHRTIGLLWRNSSASAENYQRIGKHFRDEAKRGFPHVVPLES